MLSVRCKDKVPHFCVKVVVKSEQISVELGLMQNVLSSSLHVSTEIFDGESEALMFQSLW